MEFPGEQSYKRFAAPYILFAGGLVVFLQAANLLLWGTHPPGPIFSDLIQLAMGTLCTVAAYKASRLPGMFGRYFWGFGVVTFALFVTAQALATYDNVFHAPHFIQWTINVLFFFWLTPLGMALFLNLDFVPDSFDWLLILDLVQVILFWLAGYFYFFYLPERATFGPQLGHSVWAPYFIYMGFLLAAFLLRARLADSALIRSMFLRIVVFLFATGVADYFYYYGPGKDLNDGSWYDFVWISTNFLFLVFAATWQVPEPIASRDTALVRPHTPLLVQALPLFYSLLIAGIAVRIAEQRLNWAASVILISVACSGTRLLITQLRQQRSQHLLEAVIEGASDAIFVKDREGRYLMVNASAADRVGRQVSEVVGKTCRDLYPPEAIPQILERDRRALQAGETQTFEEHLTASGVALTCLTTCGPFRDAQGRIAGSFGISRDITDRKRIEDNLRVQKLFLEQLIENAPEAIAITDPDYTIRQVNREFTRVFGYPAEEARGRNLSALIVPPDKEEESLSLENYTTRPLTSGLETKRRRKDGSLVEVSVLVSPVLVGNELDAVYSIYRDISDFKTTEEQLRQSQKMEAIGRLAGGIAHDLNNLLTVVTGYSDLQLAALAPADPKHAYAAQIKQAAERATALTQQLLAFSRRQVLQPRVIDLNFVVGSVETLLRRLLGEDIEITFTPSQNLGAIRADASQLEQVIMNLTINARDAMPEGGRLLLQTANTDLDEAYARVHSGVVPGRYVLLTVSDTGVGMDKDTLAHIFEPFFTTKGPGKGTGLGLSTVYGIVQQSQGYVFVYSEPGRGTSFKIYLPRVDEPVVQTSPSMQHTPKTLGRETILLVEDDPQVRELTCSLLQGLGYSVLVADSISAVEKHCREFPEPIHLLLTDMVMPGITGKEVAVAVSRLRPEIRILFMSGYTDDVIDHHGGLGAQTQFLQKPFTSASLAEKVNQALSSLPSSSIP
ncbi:MAG: PAS domain S-box protein [Terriglobales bacterium]